MLVSYDWLSEYVDLDGISPEDIADELNRTGIEVEVIYTRDNGLNGVVIGQVLSVSPHPQADRLRVCSVHVGQPQPLQIVCGAPNVAVGQRVPVATVGATLPGDLRIQATQLRGIESMGMICSAKELGLPDKVLMKEQTEGILVLGEDAPIGEDIRLYLGMTDQVIELELTPNRADCLSMIGVAYEIAAIFERPLTLPEVEIRESVTHGHHVDIQLEVEEECPFYVAQVVENLTIGPSPQWIQNRLISAGVRPINNIVDVTNYVMIETGQPLHAFDYDQIQDGEIIVRLAHPGESVVTLDGVTRACDDETLLISDRKQVLGIAGIMGGQSSEVGPSTNRVLIESAYFNPISIRRSSRKLGLRSEASNRFEKGVDPERIIPALSRSVQLLEEIAQGQVASDLYIEEIGDVEEIVVDLRHDRLTGLLGIQIEPSEVLKIFERLKFPTQYEDDVYHVQVPSRRPDITIEVDLIEEVARIYGYDRIPTTLPWGQQLPGGLTKEQGFRRTIRETLRGLGMNEVISYSLITNKMDKELVSLQAETKPIQIAMPMSNEHAVLRTSLLPSLLQTAVHNHKHGIDFVSIFELSSVYTSEERRLTRLPQESWELGGLMSGQLERNFWRKGKEHPLFFDTKGVLDALWKRLGISHKEVEYHEAVLAGFHPGRTAEILFDEKRIGILGQLHPKLEKQYDLHEVILFQIDLQQLFAKSDDKISYQRLSRYPAVTRDLAMIVDEDIRVGEIEAGIRQVAGELLRSVTLFDVFIGEQIGPNKKNVAYSLVYQALDRTLTDEEVQAVHTKVIQFLESTMDVKLRT
ncbi:phenylalanyl-tRNA synthetase beta subunit [Seinonella peptonophila]|uniref:Phenylalanine--tRNA ligase beta subunit n=1 Tax=Seinonella peptonophila TaxID=112248 RepID=A0A1M4U5V8_9BACL|nr:phenylalanine--tRNA ligase subunit beta [Seinonella peptonophila]SHE52068.1 phenylalanyl-tRNA synthetase beta subunit [Seinonella peptonophila]